LRYPLWRAWKNPNPGIFFRPLLAEREKTAFLRETSDMSRSKFAAPFLLLFAVAWLFGQIGLKLFSY
jgi:hypothetical protein